MATKYVYSGATGANDGTSWTDAWVALSSSTGVAAGDVIKIHKTHAETYAADTTWNWSNGTVASPVRIFVVDKDASDALSIATTNTISNPKKDIIFDGNVIMYGLVLKAGDFFFLGSSKHQHYESCSFEIDTDVFGGGSFYLCQGFAATGWCLFRECAWLFTTVGGSGAGSKFQLNGAKGRAHIIGGTITLSASPTQTYVASTNGSNGTFIFEGVTVNGTCSYLVAGGAANEFHFWRRCKLPTMSLGMVSAAPTSFSCVIAIEACVGGTITVPEYGLTRIEMYNGRVVGSLSRYRTGGANDGVQANAQSWEMVSNANCSLLLPLTTPTWSVWAPAGSQSIDFYLASGASLNDDEFGIELCSPNETAPSSTTANSRYQSSRMAWLGTPAALTTDSSSTWNGTGVGTKQKITLSINPGLAGWCYARAWLAKASTTVYVDPKPSSPTSSYQRFGHSLQLCGGNEAGSSGALIRPVSSGGGLV